MGRRLKLPVSDVVPRTGTGPSSISSQQVVKRIWIFVVCCTALATVADSQIIEGDVASCDNEGEVVEIPNITDDPCISCMCWKLDVRLYQDNLVSKDDRILGLIMDHLSPCPATMDGKVECSKEKCPDLEGCRVVLYPKLAEQCCERCMGCRFKKKSYLSGAVWTDMKDPCISLSCQGGVITRSRARCHHACKHPVKAKGQCCPVCSGCSYNNIDYGEGESFQAAGDPCVTCKCSGGTVECKRVACPVLNCVDEYIETPQGQCCPVCKGIRKIFDPGPKYCLFRKKVYPNQDTVNQGTSILDTCTDCICREGTMVCDRKVCSPLDCATEDHIVEDGVCCPRCKVPKKKCRYNGKSYKHGTHWQLDICTSCSCTDGTVHCQVQQCSNEIDCPKNTRFQYVPGQCCPDCVDEDAVCAVFGDPHYRTFDGHIYNFQGACQYTLAQDCDGRNFSIRVRNAPRLTNDFAWTKSVSIFISDWRFSLQQKLKVKIGGRRVKLPYEQEGLFAVIRGGHTVTLKTTFGVKVIWDGDSYAEISVSPAYKYKMCGLCGNYNGIESDDLTGKNGVLYLDANDFGKTWRVGRGGRGCTKKPDLSTVKSPCKRSRKRQLRAEAECSVFHHKAFSHCRDIVEVEPYIRSCHVDVCDCPKRKECHCESLMAYERACNREGVAVPQWRAPNKCGAPGCPKGAVFNICANACPRTCANRAQTIQCNRPCIPSCQCPTGTVLHQNKCVSPSRCPMNRKKKRRRRNKIALFHE